MAPPPCFTPEGLGERSDKTTLLPRGKGLCSRLLVVYNYTLAYVFTCLPEIANIYCMSIIHSITIGIIAYTGVFDDFLVWLAWLNIHQILHMWLAWLNIHHQILNSLRLSDLLEKGGGLKI